MSRHPLRFDPIAEAERNWERAGWADAASGMALVTSVMRVHQILLARVDAVLAPFHLTFARYEALMLLFFSSRGSLPLGKIGQRLQVHPASVTNVIDRLEVDGLVRREPHPVDGRTTLAAITARGRRVAEQSSRLLNRDVFGDGVLDRHAQVLVPALRLIRRDAGDFL